jgi:uncharacterized protein (TIGR03067 family)
MRRFILAALVVGLVVGADRKDDAKKELMKFQGEWVPVSVELNGTALTEAGVKDVRVIVKGDKLTIKERDKTSEGSFALDPTKKPKHIDGTGKDSQGKEHKTIGIHEFDGDKLKLCYTLAGGERPKEFSSKGGTQKNPIMLVVYQRAKKEK